MAVDMRWGRLGKHFYHRNWYIILRKGIYQIWTTDFINRRIVVLIRRKYICRSLYTSIGEAF